MVRGRRVRQSYWNWVPCLSKDAEDRTYPMRVEGVRGLSRVPALGGRSVDDGERSVEEDGTLWGVNSKGGVEVKGRTLQERRKRWT